MAGTPRLEAVFRRAAFWRGFWSIWGHPYTRFFLGGSVYGLVLGRFLFR